ncbi:hypothetical protein KCU73_g1341, partial [Aureobasidium melanogenum]
MRFVYDSETIMPYCTTAVVFFSCAASALAASCSSFTASQDAYTQPALRTSIISKGVICNSTTNDCRVPIGGYVTDQRTLNITIDSAGPIFESIAAAVEFPFNETVTTWVGASTITSEQTWPIKSGTSGYIGFTPNHRCTSGRLSGCDSSTLEGSYVEACTPYSIADSQLSGTIAAIVADGSVVETLTCNPANTTAAQNGNSSNSCSSTDSKPTGSAPTSSQPTNSVPESRASNMHRDISLALLLGSVVAAILGS